MFARHGCGFGNVCFFSLGCVPIANFPWEDSLLHGTQHAFYVEMRGCECGSMLAAIFSVTLKA